MTKEKDLAIAERYELEAKRIQEDIRETESLLPHYADEPRKDIEWVLGEQRTAVTALLGIVDWYRERAKRKE
jgi:hypothetical protein